MRDADVTEDDQYLCKMRQLITLPDGRTTVFSVRLKLSPLAEMRTRSSVSLPSHSSEVVQLAIRGFCGTRSVMTLGFFESSCDTKWLSYITYGWIMVIESNGSPLTLLSFIIHCAVPIQSSIPECSSKYKPQIKQKLLL